ncbi:hypothetical protein MMC13_005236 [Lambiella insularis]|nr:hypothetical protein [Lambiella insularis]
MPLQLQTQNTDACTSVGEKSCMSGQPTQSETKPPTMSIAILPPPRIPASKRPKLSLQTSTIPQPFAPRSANALSISHSADSPTLRNTYENASATQTALSSQLGKPRGSSLSQQAAQSTSASPQSSRENSPNVPYFLPIGARSILRNSPLPARYVTPKTSMSARTPQRLFPPIKRVLFHEMLEELMPTPVIEESEPSDTDSDFSASRRKRGREAMPNDTQEVDEGEDMPSTPVQGRSKRRREWVWTLGPTEDGRLSPNAGPLLRKGMDRDGEKDGEQATKLAKAEI